MRAHEARVCALSHMRPRDAPLKRMAMAFTVASKYTCVASGAPGGADGARRRAVRGRTRPLFRGPRRARAARRRRAQPRHLAGAFQGCRARVGGLRRRRPAAGAPAGHRVTPHAPVARVLLCLLARFLHTACSGLELFDREPERRHAFMFVTWRLWTTSTSDVSTPQDGR